MAINLLPPKFKREKRIQKTAKIIFVFLTVICFVILILTGGLFAADYFTQKDIQKSKSKIAEQKRIFKRYEEIENNVNDFNSKLTKIQSIESQKISWSSILLNLSSSTPTNVQIKTFSAADNNKRITITGYAETRNDIAVFKEKLEKSEYFKNVTFSSSVHNEENKNFSFNISCELEKIK